MVGKELFNIGMGEEDDGDGFIKGVKEGKGKFEGNERFKEFMDVLDLRLNEGGLGKVIF
ncbi:hypothetical protein [Priestia megaterium]|uniref:hypothetical protein n=1 Tax=Priestia megaterium TaxID=1404 RepID=UPI0016498B52|nr:hypothetical protein [Priestia megaterium]